MVSSATDSSHPPGAAPVTGEAVLALVCALAAEMHPNRAAMPRSLDASLERDFGFDSLGRVELLARLERSFAVSLSEHVMVTAETPRDLVRALLAEHPVQSASPQALERVATLEAESQTPDAATTLPQVLAWHVSAHAARVHLVLQADDGSEQSVTYGELDQGARAVAAGLVERGLEPGRAVAIMLPTGVDYFYSFFGILLAGGIPVPIYPPARPTQIEDHLRRHAGILSNALTECLITVPQAKPLALLLKPRVATLRDVVTPQDLMRPGSSVAVYRARPQDIAMLQYTSGSTGNPKGVVLTHANLLVNIRAMGRALRVTPADVFVSWLPLYHDMGLIGAWMGSLVYGFKFPVMSPLTFLARPQRWLRTIHRHGGTLSGGPNFCYELCVRRIQDADMEGLDLSSWRFAFNGAEPVVPETMEAFIRRFARWGFKPEAMSPVYGLAEATLGVSFTAPSRGVLLDRVGKSTFMQSGRAVPAAPGELEALTFVACGQTIPGHQVRIVDGTGHELPDRTEGHIQFSGPSVTSGYYRNPETTAKLLDGEWMNTDDYGYVVQGELYITGRIKDMIIRAGRNIHPYDLEQAVGNLAGIRKGCVAVFGSRDARSGTERIVALAETRESDPGKREQLQGQINDLAVAMIGSPVDDVMLVAPGTVPKTSSGKIRRAASRELYERGGAQATRAVWLQVVRLTWAAVLPQSRRWLRAGVDLMYGAYALAMLGLLGAVTWVTCALVPSVDWCWRFSGRMARLFARLIGIHFSVQGLQGLPAGRPLMLVANHASYLDGVMMIAALSEPRSFVAKRELLDHWVPRIYLSRIGTAFVERFDPQRGVEDTGRFVEEARSGRSFIVFPEGTFRRMPGLLPFRMGAFVVAAQAGLEVVPVAIRGTRSILRSGEWLLRRGRIAVVIDAPIAAGATDWAAAIALRDQARARLLRSCGEPDLSEETTLAPKRTPAPS